MRKGSRRPLGVALATTPRKRRATPKGALPHTLGKEKPSQGCFVDSASSANLIFLAFYLHFSIQKLPCRAQPCRRGGGGGGSPLRRRNKQP